jgi:hypothetical protein
VIELVRQPFPFGKYKKVSARVGEALLDPSYLRWLKENVASWRKGHLLTSLVQSGILRKDGIHLTAMGVTLCQTVHSESKKSVVMDHPTPSELTKEKEKEEKKQEAEKSQRECAFCMDPLPLEGVRYAFHPCMHAILCEDCGENKLRQIKSLYTCPVCRTYLDLRKQVTKIYL